MMKRTQLILAFLLVCLFGNIQAQTETLHSRISLFKGFPIITDMPGGYRYLDKIAVNVKGSQTYPTDQNFIKYFAIDIYLTDNSCNASNGQLIGHATFKTSLREINKTVTIDIADQIYSCTSCRFAKYYISMKIRPLTYPGGPVHGLDGWVSRCSLFTNETY